MTQWLEFVNRANSEAIFGRFALLVESDETYSVRVTAIALGAYETKAFGHAIGMWQQDLTLLGNAPRPAPDPTPVSPQSGNVIFH
jgi:hypothetical protein